MDEAGKVAQERDNLIVETRERVLELRGATNLSIIEGHLYLFRTIKKRRASSQCRTSGASTRQSAKSRNRKTGRR